MRKQKMFVEGASIPEPEVSPTFSMPSWYHSVSMSEILCEDKQLPNFESVH